MPKVLVTGGGGLIGSRVCEMFHVRGFEVFSVDNDLRGHLLGDPEGSVQWNLERLAKALPNFTNYFVDIRQERAMHTIFNRCKFDAIVHCAAQPAHEGKGGWGEDFEVNVLGTLNVLSTWKAFCPDASFVNLSTIKVYGNAPNQYFQDLQCLGRRYDLDSGHRYHRGFDESLPLGGAGSASFFSRSKTAADLYVQEFAYQFDLPAVCLRASCVTGGHHSGTEAHGMLAYMMKCAFLKKPYTIYGYQGYQVRDQLHVDDLVEAIWEVVRAPKSGVVFNIGGGRPLACSILEAIALCEEVTGSAMRTQNCPGRVGDHAWWVTDTGKFHEAYPGWKPQVSLKVILEDIYEKGKQRWTS